MANNSQAGKDVFRDSPLRLLGYANEVGESFRSIIPVRYVNMSYVVAFGYCLADTCDKTIRSRTACRDQSYKGTGPIVTAADTLLWQLLASVVIPGFTINRICFATRLILRRTSSLTVAKINWTSTAVGLTSIPLIVKPIDHAVDKLMDATCRKLY